MPKIEVLRELCCGCAACAAVCPKECIYMKVDVFGFLQPAVDVETCADCGMCERVCPVIEGRESDGCKAVWWARSRDDNLLLTSSSGGAFGSLARHILADGGVVYGAAFDVEFRNVSHVRVDSIDDLGAVVRSKYVQSTVGKGIYYGVETDLRVGRRVLFCGTSCQVSGIRGFLETRRVPTEGLLLVDIICHGAPSPGLWHKWLDYKEEAADGKVCSINFRSKLPGWTTCSVVYEFATEKTSRQIESDVFSKDWYVKAFLQNASLRGSCFECPAKRSCGSDLTLGDFWGIRAAHPEAYDEKGVSAVIANTMRGREAVESLGNQLMKGESTFDAVIGGNSALIESVIPYPDREAFLSAIAEGTDIRDIKRIWPFKQPFYRWISGKFKSIVKIAMGRG